jgi:hypothetical protein
MKHDFLKKCGRKFLSVVECVRKIMKYYNKYFRVAGEEINP